MKRRQKIAIICLLIAFLLLAVPIPGSSEDEGIIYLHSIIPMLEIYIYDSVYDPDIYPGTQMDNLRKSGYQICLCKMPIYERTYYTSIE